MELLYPSAAGSTCTRRASRRVSARPVTGPGAARRCGRLGPRPASCCGWWIGSPPPAAPTSRWSRRGVYWLPVYNLLEGSVEVCLVNAHHVKAVPGRKTDVRDSEWLAQLLELGLLRRSFVPPAAPRELRAVVRERKRPVEGGG